MNRNSSRHKCWAVPLPDEAKSSPPGIFFARSMMSATVLASTDGVTTRRLGTSEARNTGSKSLAVERQLWIERRVDRVGGGVVHNGVAVGIGLGRNRRADGATGAAAIVDDEGLA